MDLIFGRLLRRVKDYSAKRPVFRLYGSHFLSSSSNEERLIRELSDRLNSPNLFVKRFAITETGVLVFVLGGGREGFEYVAKVAIGSNSQASLVRNYKNLSILKSTFSSVEPFFPRQVTSFVFENGLERAYTYVETSVSGVTASDYLYTEKFDCIINSAVEFWKKIPSCSCCGKDGVLDYISSKANNLTKSLAGLGLECDHILGSILNKINYEQRIRLSLGPVHGDYWLGNIILSKDGEISLIDWDGFEPFGIQELDLLHLLLYSKAQRLNMSLSKVWMEFMANENRFSKYFHGYNDDELNLIGSLYWLSFLSNSKYPKGQKWIDSNVCRPISFLEKVWSQ